MKIAIDCRMSGKSGIGTYLDNILEHLLLSRTSHSFLLVGDQSRLDRYLNIPKCQILHTNIPILSLKELFCFPIKEINRCDLFYSPNYNLPLGIKIPIFSTIHDVVFLDVNGLTSKIGKIIRWLILWRAIKISKTIFTVSNFSKERIHFHFNTNINIILTYNGIQNDLQNFIKQPNSPYNFPYILFVGNIKRHKGINILLKAYYQARKNGFIPKLVIVGSFKNFRTTDDRIVNLIKREDPNIIFTGQITNNQLYNILAYSSLLVQPSIYEGFGIPPLEALYLGCNVLISDIPVFKEIYGKLPVEFFNVNSNHDLEEKMINYLNNTSPSIDIKKDIDNLYNFNKSAQIIIKEFESIKGL